MIIGSKADLVDKREVMKQAVEEFAKEQGISIVAEVAGGIVRQVPRPTRASRRPLQS